MNRSEAIEEALKAILDEKCRQCYINDQICTHGLKCHWNGKRGEICQDEAMDKAIAALSAPARNCDRPECQSQTDAIKVWKHEDGGKTAYYDWLLAPAEKGADA